MGLYCGYTENVLPSLSSFTCSSPLADDVLVSQPVLERVYLRMLFPELSSPTGVQFFFG